MLAQRLLPKFVLSAVFAAGAFVTFFESIYLRDQAREFNARSIDRWMWIFRAMAAGCSIALIAAMFA